MTRALAASFRAAQAGGHAARRKAGGGNQALLALQFIRTHYEDAVGVAEWLSEDSVGDKVTSVKPRTPH
jgi:hypothetical protein